MKFLFALLIALGSTNAHARIEALFHPQDPTLEKIARWIYEAESTVDIAMYNMDTTDKSPVIRVLKEPAVQTRIQSGQLRVRVIFEGYAVPPENDQKKVDLEKLGADVRFLGKSVKIHHKFAVIDSLLAQDRVITGSANWSLASALNYSENILFLTQEPEATAEYQKEFLRLWQASKEFGESAPVTDDKVPFAIDQNDVAVHFNSGRTLNRRDKTPELTAELVKQIDQAETSLDIATARVTRKPILEALARAADRGIKIRVLVSQDDFRNLGPRAPYLFRNKNIQFRVKFYNLKVKNYLSYQMHNKYAVIDGKTLWTGSFNWSDSSELKHIENVIVLSGLVAKDILPAYQGNFQNLWVLGREQYTPLLENLKSHTHTECAIPQMSLTPNEIKYLLKFGSRCK